MKCKNCYATIESQDVRCPFCGFEGAAESKRYIKPDWELDRRQNWKNDLKLNRKHDHELKPKSDYDYAPKQKLNTSSPAVEPSHSEVEKSTKNKNVIKRLPLGVIRVALTLILALIFFVFDLCLEKLPELPIIGEYRQERIKEEVNTLESYYEKGLYSEMYEYYTNKCTYDGSDEAFEKYWRVGEAYDSFKSNKNELIEDADPELINDCDESDTLLFFKNDYYSIFSDLSDLKMYEDEGFPYDEGDAILKLKQDYYDLLTNTGRLSIQEIEDAMALYEEIETDDELTNDAYTYLAKITLKRTKEAMTN